MNNFSNTVIPTRGEFKIFTNSIMQHALKFRHLI